MTGDDGRHPEGRRLDKWLYFARFCKTRALAARLAAAKRVRVNTVVVTKPHHRVRPGDVLTFPQGPSAVRVVRVVALGERRGPASEARRLYVDLNQEAPGAPGPGEA